LEGRQAVRNILSFFTKSIAVLGTALNELIFAQLIKSLAFSWARWLVAMFQRVGHWSSRILILG